MILIADSGSTKTSWCLTDGSERHFWTTQGLNPYQQDKEEMTRVVTVELLPELTRMFPEGRWPIDAVYFYGAGCTAEMSPVVASALNDTVAEHAPVHVASDMLGAARALAKHDEGIVCILGTGSNSCLYDGTAIVCQVAPLGVILGDEGSGAYIGKRLAADCLKGQFSEEICRLFRQETGLSSETIVRKVYREPFPNRFLASLSPFCARHRDMTEIHRFLVDCFHEFFSRNVARYGRPELPSHFIGSVAWFYRDELREAAGRCGYEVGRVVQSPMEGLIRYHADTPQQSSFRIQK